MKLSAEEQKLVASLRQQQKSFARWRWGALFIAFMCMASGADSLWISRHYFRPAGDKFKLLTYAAPIGSVMLASGIFLLTYTLLAWKGRPEVKLLLRLVDEADQEK